MMKEANLSDTAASGSASATAAPGSASGTAESAADGQSGCDVADDELEMIVTCLEEALSTLRHAKYIIVSGIVTIFLWEGVYHCTVTYL